MMLGTNEPSWQFTHEVHCMQVDCAADFR